MLSSALFLFMLKLYKKYKYYIFSFLVSVFLFFLIFELSGRLISSSYTFVHDDLAAGVPEWILLSISDGSFGEYSYLQALGFDTIASVPSPFLLFVLLTTNRSLGYYLAVSFELSLSAVFMYHFLSRWVSKRNTLLDVAFSVCYSLCSYNLIFYYNTHFLEGVYLLPLLMNFLLDILTNNRGKWKLKLTLTYLFLTSYYEGYMVGIFLAVILFFYSCFCYEHFSAQKLIKNVFSLFLCALNAAMMAAIILYPLALNLYSANTIDSIDKVDKFHLLPQDFLSSLFYGSVRNESCEFPALYTGVVFILCIPLLLHKSKEHSKKIKLFLGVVSFLLLCSFEKHFYLMIHMFNDPDDSRYRFVYMISFVLISLSTYVLHQVKNSKKELFIALVIVSVSCIASYYFQNKYSTEVLLSPVKVYINIIILCVYCFLILDKEKNKWKINALFFAILIEIAVNGIELVKTQESNFREQKNYSSAYEQNQRNVLNGSIKLDTNLYRVKKENTDGTFTEGLYYQYNSLGTFNPALNPNIRQLYQKLGYLNGSKGLFDAGGSLMTDSVLGVKYYIDMDIFQPEKESVARLNTTYLPFAFGASSYIKNLEYTDNNVFENQNGLISCLIGEELRVFEPVYQENLKYEYKNVLFSYQDFYEGYVLVKKDDDELGYIILDIDSEVDDAYIYFLQETNEITDYAPKVDTNLEASAYQANDIYKGNIIKLKKNDDGSYHVEVVFDQLEDDIAFLRGILVYTFSDAVWEDAYNDLADSKLENYKWENDALTGTITIADDKNVLFTSIPYSEFWKIYIDGQEVETYSIINESLLACDIEPGTHDIKMVYHNTNRDIGLITSCAGLFWFLLEACIRLSKGKWRQKQAK